MKICGKEFRAHKTVLAAQSSDFVRKLTQCLMLPRCPQYLYVNRKMDLESTQNKVSEVKELLLKMRRNHRWKITPEVFQPNRHQLHFSELKSFHKNQKGGVKVAVIYCSTKMTIRNEITRRLSWHWHGHFSNVLFLK